MTHLLDREYRMAEEQFTPMQLGRILERLDQQDKNTLNAAEQLRREAVRLAEEAKDNTIRISEEFIRHADEDTKRFAEVNNKLDELLELKAQVKGGKAVMWAIFAALSFVVGSVLTYLGLK